MEEIKDLFFQPKGKYMKNTFKTMALIGFFSVNAQATQGLDHPFQASEEQINGCTYCPQNLYRDPIKVAFIVKGDELRDESVRITCSDARSVLLPHKPHGSFAQETYAVMPGGNMKSLDQPIYLNYNQLPTCYEAFKPLKIFESMQNEEKSKLVKTYNFGSARNLNGVSVKIEETQSQNLWTFWGGEWSAEFDFYPWMPGVIGSMCTHKDIKNESNLMFEIKGSIAGVSYPKLSSIHPYTALIDSTSRREALQSSGGEYATVCFGGNFKENNPYYVLKSKLEGGL
jgi:hypothetical protein